MAERILEPVFDAYVISAADEVKDAKKKFKASLVSHRTASNKETLKEVHNNLAEYGRSSKKLKRSLLATQLEMNF